MDIETRIGRLEDVEHIRSLKAHYCDLCDEGYDADALIELFTADAVWDGGELGRFDGRDAIHRFFSNMPRAMSFAIHHITNAAVRIGEDGNTATGRWYLLQAATTTRDSQAVWLAGRYDDELVREQDRWLFRQVKLQPRFLTPFEKGWAEVPFADLSGRA